MEIKSQFEVIKKNWLIVVGLIVIILILGNFNISDISRQYSNSVSNVGFGMAYDEGLAVAEYYPGQGRDFAPDVEDRIITKTASLSLEVERGDFEIIHGSLKNSISESDGIIINENVNSYGEGITKRKIGSYSLKIPVENYDSFILDIKDLGEIESFSENSEDITGDYINLEDRLELEKEKLVKYEKLFNSATSIDDKISLTDMIFNQERTIKYLEDAIENQDLRIEYISVYLTLSEEQSKFTNITIIGFGEIFRSLVNSLNQVITLIMWVIPWIILFFIGKYLFRFIKKKHK